MAHSARPVELLKSALDARQKLRPKGTERVHRIFHGPGEAPNDAFFSRVLIDRFDSSVFVSFLGETSFDQIRTKLADFEGVLNNHEIDHGVILTRPSSKVPEKPELWFGKTLEHRWVEEWGIRYKIKFLDIKNPGLFLDHQDLRRFLLEHSSGKRVLNTFCYTGSLGLCAAKGGASNVVSVDLSKATLDWARENFENNGFSGQEKFGFFAEDVFKFFGRALKWEPFDTVILDPPSFSRTKSDVFSTQKDLKRLHEGAIKTIKTGGWLVTSINSSNISRETYLKDLFFAAESLGKKLRILKTLEQNPDFYTMVSSRFLDNEADRYLKGWIFEVT